MSFSKICFCVAVPDAHLELSALDSKFSESILFGVVNSLKATGWKSFVSPLHYAEDDDEFYTSRMAHYHVMSDLGGRFSKSRVLHDLSGCGVPAINGYFEPVKDWRNYALYLLHRTVNSKHKQQFTNETVTCVNCPPSTWLRDIEVPYIFDISDLIDFYAISEPRELFARVSQDYPEYLPLVFRDVHKWSSVLYLDKPPDE